MFAVVKTGGKQYRVEAGMVLDVDSLPGNVGEQVQIADVLLVCKDDQITVGQPLVEGATVAGEILQQKRGPKVIVFKKIRRHGKRWKKGHRQELTRLKITDISLGGR